MLGMFHPIGFVIEAFFLQLLGYLVRCKIYLYIVP